VTEDMDLVITLREHAARNNAGAGFSFTSDPVCWTECPSTFRMLSRQRRRWQLGLCQCLRKHRGMLFRPVTGLSACSAYLSSVYRSARHLVEFLGYVLVPLSFFGGLISPALLGLFILLGLAYGGFLSVGLCSSRR